MEDYSFRGDVPQLKASFVDAALGKIGPALLSYSVSISDKKIFARLIVDQKMTEVEEEDVYDILGGMVGDWNDVCGDFELIRAESGYRVRDDEVLPIELFRRAP